MARYRITDKQTGRTAVVSGETPPSEEAIAQIFQATEPKDSGYTVPPMPTMPPPKSSPSVIDYIGELTAGLARPIASLVDIAMSPVAVGYELVTGKEAKGASTMIAPRGAYTGDDVLGQALGAGGELASSSLTIGQAGRSLVTNLLDEAAVAGESAIKGVLRQFGSSTPADDVLAGFISGTSSEIAAQSAEEIGMSPNAVESVRAVVGLGAPIAVAPVLNRLTDTVGSFLRKPGATPSVEEIKGASRALFQQIDDLGIIFTEDSTKKLVSNLDESIVEEGLTTFLGETQLATQALKLKSLLEAEGNFNGTSFKVLDKAREAFNAIAVNKTDNQARIARILRDKVDDFLMSAAVSDVSKTTTTGKELALPGQVLTQQDNNAISRTLVNARQLWKRAKSSQLVEDTFKDAEIAALGSEGQQYEKVLVENLRQLLRSEQYATQFTSRERESVASVIQGSSVRRRLEGMRELGIKSDTYIKAALFGAAGAAYAGYMTPQATVVAGGLLTTSILSKAAGEVARRYFLTDAHTMRSMMRAGSNGKALARMYLSRTPRKDRKPEELASILKQAGVDLSTLEGKQALPSPFIADSVAFARGIEQLESSLPSEQPVLQQQ